MATEGGRCSSDDGDPPVVESTITLTHEESGWWVAKDEKTGVASQGKTREEALENLDEAVALHKGEIGETVEDEEAVFRKLGIDPEEVPKDRRDEVFTAGHSTDEDGTGFGLSIVKQIVEAHGWRIHVTESAQGIAFKNSIWPSGNRFQIFHKIAIPCRRLPPWGQRQSFLPITTSEILWSDFHAGYAHTHSQVESEFEELFCRACLQ